MGTIDFSTLNEAQYRAVMSDAGRLLCLAGAGTGKTRVLTCRVARLYQGGVETKHMACLTFTRAAGAEMKERIIGMIGDAGRQLFCNTFHAFCVRIIRHRGNLMGYDEKFSIYDQDDQRAILSAIIGTLHYQVSLKQVLDYRAGRWAPKPPEEKQCKEILKEYDFRLRQNNAIDFDGLLETALRLLHKFPSVRQEYHRRYPYLFVDEFQDTDHRQLELINLIDPEHLFVVGDDFQSIYGFRGSDIDIILGMAKNPAFEVVKLERNYRSTMPIVAAANALIRNNTQTEKTLTTGRPGDPVECAVWDDADEEVTRTAERISDLVQSARARYGDIAILARTNRQIEAAKEGLDAAGIPCTLMNAARDPLKGSDAKQILAWLDAVINPSNDAGIRKVIDYPTPTIGALGLLEVQKYQYKAGGTFLDAIRATGKAPEFLHRYGAVSAAILQGQADGRPVSEDGSAAFVEAARRTGALGRYADEYRQNRLLAISEAIAEIDAWKARQQEIGEPFDVEAMLQWVALRDIQDKAAEAQRDEVRLMTVHGSKGLEFPIVFVIGMNQGTFPGRGNLEEERRLFYVAMTRAKDRLFLSRARTDCGWGGNPEPQEPSRFLDEIGEISLTAKVPDPVPAAERG